MSLLSPQSHNASDSDAIAGLVPQPNDSRPTTKLSVVPLHSPSLPEPKIPLLNVIPKPVRWQSYLHPLWLLSLGLHLVLLSIPIPAKQTPPKPPRSVKLTKLAPTPKPKTKTPLKPKLAAQPKPVINSLPSLPSPNSPVKSAPIAVVPKPTPPKQAPKVTPSPEATPKATTKPEPEPDRGSESGLKNFPQYPDASPACGDYCSETSANLTTVANYFVKTLKAQTWQVNPLNTTETSGQQLFYQVTKGDLNYVLSILTTATNKTQYMLADQPLTLSDFAQAEASAGDIGDILDKASGGNKVTEDIIARKNLFTSKPSIISSFLMEGATPDSAIETIRADLIAKGFEVKKTSQTYADGPIYSVKLNMFTGYLNPVLSSDRKGTVIVFWKHLPAQD